MKKKVEREISVRSEVKVERYKKEGKERDIFEKCIWTNSNKFI